MCLSLINAEGRLHHLDAAAAHLHGDTLWEDEEEEDEERREKAEEEKILWQRLEL